MNSMQKLSLDESVTLTPTLDTSSPATLTEPNLGPTANSLEQRQVINRNFGLERSNSMSRQPSSVVFGIMIVLAIAAGTATGYGGYLLKAKASGTTPLGGSETIQKIAGDSVKAGQIFGVQDEKTFKDSAEGYLEEGGVNGEGSHHLLRAGGASQTVVLTSSVTDLSKLTGMQVKVWGETFKAQKAGWLMDVGRVQVVNPQGSPPTEE